ncbi:MAG: 4-(cytidine 5'-diphospho)-2-C-methyl-D-erythritol kinase [Alphaproteobacteria bacterium]|nr:4-(cytidine 5'-diphospho)-2-C-methyl-D-erythritol kinase [Alphaproteobacteria bacterium]
MTTSKPARRFAPAKINLFLHVGDKRTDGYHDLVSLIAFADTGDWLEVRDAKRQSLSITGPFADALKDETDNLVLKAARDLDVWAEERGHKTSPVELILEKNLPIAAGIGGGSSDAAAVLHLLAEHWSLPIPIDELESIGKAMGADVPVCLRGCPTLVSGMGEILSPAPELPAFSLVLVNPGIEVPTKRIFNTISVRSGTVPPPFPPRFESARTFAMFLDGLFNDLAAPAKAIAPVIMSAEGALVATEGCLIARMSGSGATCVGLYEKDEDAVAAAAKIAQANPNWWVKAARTFVSP